MKNNLFEASGFWYLDVWENRGLGVLFVRRQFVTKPGRVALSVARAVAYIKIKLS